MSVWKFIEINNETFVFKIVNKNDSIECCTSNFKEIWIEDLKMSDFYKRAKFKNPLIEYNEETILKAINLPGNYQFNINPVDNTAEFQIKTYDADIPFRFYWALQKCNQEMFFDQITKPLLMALMELEFQKRELIDVVEKKDTEIQQFKIEGATLIRKHVSTAPFIENDFLKKFKTHGKLDLINLVKKDDHLPIVYKLCDIDTLFATASPAENTDLNGDTMSKSSIGSGKSGTTPRKNKRLKANMRQFQGKPEAKLTYDNPNDSSSDEDRMNNVAKNESNNIPTTVAIKKPKFTKKLKL